jgi:hypothetical protein
MARIVSLVAVRIGGMRGLNAGKFARSHVDLGLDQRESAKAKTKVVKKAKTERMVVKKAKAKTKVVNKIAEDLEESMRRLSVGSDESDFLLVSRTSRTNSFDSVRSLDSVQSADSISLPQRRSRKNSTESWNSQDPGNSVLSLDTVKSLDSIVGGVNISEISKSMDTDTNTESQDEDERVGNPAWYAYGNFEPEPTAPFRIEFDRLARYKGWGREIRRYWLIDLLRAEVEFHFGDGAEKLHDFQDLCENLGIEDVPSTLTQCRKVSKEDVNSSSEYATNNQQALTTVKIDLWSLIDNKRNPQTAIFHFSSHSELRRHARKKRNTFLRQAAKVGSGVVAALLHRLF